MSPAGLRPVLILASLVLGLAACAPHQIYRPDTALCSSPMPEQKCLTSAIQEYRDPNHLEAGYLLGFVEFDDQGQLWSRRQMRDVIDDINLQASENDVLMIVFVHGWKHSAAPEDGNIDEFRDILKRISALESRVADQSKKTARKVIGVYLGWRGASITAPFLEELTFWDRKATAQKVGHGAVAEVLIRLELVKKTKDAQVRDSLRSRVPSASNDAKSRTRLVVIGHSFGGALVFSAVAPLLEDRFVLTREADEGAAGDARGFGDLVVLINPAFEANLYAPLSDMTTERRSYFNTQRPVLAVLTSEADDATRVAFPLGRSFSTFLEVERVVTRANPVSGEDESIDQGQGNITAVGHFTPYRTHYLRPVPMPQNRMQPTMAEEMTMLSDVSKAWEKDAPGHVIRFHGSVLERTSNSVGRNPYLIVQVNKDLIPNHNDIYDPRVTTFLRQLIFMSVQ